MSRCTPFKITIGIEIIDPSMQIHSTSISQIEHLRTDLALHAREGQVGLHRKRGHPVASLGGAAVEEVRDQRQVLIDLQYSCLVVGAGIVGDRKYAESVVLFIDSMGQAVPSVHQHLQAV